MNEKAFQKYLATGEYVPSIDEAPKSDLEHHDARFHPHGYKEGDSCKFRDALAKRDDVDNIRKAKARELSDHQDEARVVKDLQESFEKHCDGGLFAKSLNFKDEEHQISLMKDIWDVVVDNDSDLAKKVKSTIERYMDLDEEGYPLNDKDDDFGQVDSPFVAAIKKVKEIGLNFTEEDE